jgi:8-oxo-dGTP pyrophosphatase MutT (NUDIX family)
MIRNRLFHFYWRFARPMTLGVRGVVLDADKRVFLVRHGYAPGWHFPGGGVEAGETLLDALKRELLEEGNIQIKGPPRLHGMFHNTKSTKRDHVAVFVVREFEFSAPHAPRFEIREAGFFPLDKLPEGTTDSTRQRIEEILDGAEINERW